jgi:methylated-DNA-protein-cysteine methyltransferase related protein
MNHDLRVGKKVARLRIIDCIQAIPYGMVSTYGAVARAADVQGGARQVAATLRYFSEGVPWHRVVGAGGEIKLPGHAAVEQRLLLENEGVKFRGRRVDILRHEFEFSGSANSRRMPRTKT